MWSPTPCRGDDRLSSIMSLSWMEECQGTDVSKIAIFECFSSSNEHTIMAGMWFRDIDSCSSLPVLLGPAWVLLNCVMHIIEGLRIHSAPTNAVEVWRQHWR